MTETQASITAWAVDAFGPDGTDFRIVARANDELAELLRAVAGTRPCRDCGGADEFCLCGGAYGRAIREEAADVVIVLARWADRHGMDLLPVAGAAPVRAGVEDLAISAALCMARLLAWSQAGHGREAGAMVRAIVDAVWEVCTILGGDLQAEVDRKMAVNRSRTWMRNAAGRGYHVHAVADVAVVGVGPISAKEMVARGLSHRMTTLLEGIIGDHLPLAAIPPMSTVEMAALGYGPPCPCGERGLRRDEAVVASDEGGDCCQDCKTAMDACSARTRCSGGQP